MYIIGAFGGIAIMHHNHVACALIGALAGAIMFTWD